MAKAGLAPNRQLGQNFLVHSETARTIVTRTGISETDIVLEIGPGLGGLTIPLAKKAGAVHAVELDRGLAALLENRLEEEHIRNVHLEQMNFLDFDMSGLFSKYQTPFVVAGNLPYNISSQILVKLIQQRHMITRAYLMFQKELAKRLVSGPGTRDYGRITVMLAYCSTITTLMDIGAGQFFPRPGVDSRVVEIRFHPPVVACEDESLLFLVIKSAFGKRRKTLQNALSNGFIPELGKEEVKTCLIQAGIDPKRRAETLSVNEFVDLTSRIRNCLAG